MSDQIVVQPPYGWKLLDNEEGKGERVIAPPGTVVVHANVSTGEATFGPTIEGITPRHAAVLMVTTELVLFLNCEPDGRWGVLVERIVPGGRDERIIHVHCEPGGKPHVQRGPRKRDPS